MSQKELQRIKATLNDHEKRLAHLESQSDAEPPKTKKSLSIKEFILQKKPESDVERILVIGYFLEHSKKVSPFSVKELENAFREAKEPVPGNINDAVNKNIRKGHMMEEKEKKEDKKAWTLTSTGERFVENNLASDKSSEAPR